MTAKVIAVGLAVVAVVVIASELLDVARRSLTVAIVATVAFAIGRLTSPRRGRVGRRPGEDE